MTIPGTYTQRDPRWGSAELGFNNADGSDPYHYYNMYHFGCLVTAVSNVMWDAGYGPDPGAVNIWLKDDAHKGFEAGGGNMIWSVAHQLMAQANLQYVGYTADINALNQFLAPENNFAICQLQAPGFPMHFSAAPFVGIIQDSWDAVTKPIAGNYTFVGAHMYSKVVIPAVVDAPSTVAPTIVAPIPVTVPDPVISSTIPVADPNPVVETPVTVPTDNIVQPYSYVPFVGGPRDMVLAQDTVAIDLSGAKPPKNMTAGTTIKLSGTMSASGHDYYRGTSGFWYGVLQEAFKSGQATGAVKVSVSSNIKKIETVAIGIEAAATKRWGSLARFLRSLFKH